MLRSRWTKTGLLALVGVLCTMPLAAQRGGGGASGQGRRAELIDLGPMAALSQILGRPTDRSIALSVLSQTEIEAYVEFGTAQGNFSWKTQTASAKAGAPFVIEIDRLRPNTRYHYRLLSRLPGAAIFSAGAECAFHTQRPPGATFTFALQGDSHPERYGKMYHPKLYERTMRNVRADAPDFYLTLGDDFSLDRLIERNALSQANVDRVYAAHQRGFLGLVGRSSPLFLVNGNHEQAAWSWLDGKPNNAAVLAGRARTRFFPLPAPDAFYGGNSEEVEFVGLPRDYYSWHWGDALFVVIDPYWHAPPIGKVNAGDGGGQRRGRRGERARRGEGRPDKQLTDGRPGDLWEMSLGDAQYRWLAETLTKSQARFKFVFAHHVLGTGRGGVEMAGLYEWGGKDKRGVSAFAERRPGWELPIHALMVKTGVTVFFQGHDHLFARQELDGVIYQSTPNPADDTYQAFNREAYRSGDILPNSGHLRVTVSPKRVRVDYVRSCLPKDETDDKKNGQIAFSYTIPPAEKGEE